MIVNGKEVLVDKKDFERAARIQDEINKQKLPEELKRFADTKELKTANEVIDGVDSFNSTMFDEMNNDSEFNTRREGYEVYEDMSRMDVINKSLEIVADDSTQRNQDGKVLQIFSDNEAVKSRIEDLFYNRLDMNNELWSIIYDTCKMGDNFYEVVVDNLQQPKKIMGIKYLEPNKVDRVEIDDKLAFFTYKVEGKRLAHSAFGRQKDIKEVLYKLQPWQVIHFKMEDKNTAPYGASLLKAGVRTFKRIMLLEDVSLVYRISRAPERRIFYVDVGNLNNIEATRFLKKFKDNYRTQSFLDENGKINKKANLMSITQDIFIPTREGGTSTKVEALQGGTALGGQDDLLKYFKDKIVRLMNIPPAYLGDDSDRGRASLASQDIKFSKFVERIQAHIIKTLNKIAALDLYFGGYKKDDLFNFSIEMTPPSNIREITELEFVNQKISLVQNMMNLNIFPLNYILKKVLRMSDKEVANLQLYKKLEAQMAAQDPNAGALPADAAAGMGGIPAAPDMGAGAAIPEVPTGAPGEVPAAAAAAELPAPEATPPVESAMINILGKEFLVENQKDFFRVSKFAALSEEVMRDNDPTTSALLEQISDYLLNNRRVNTASKNIEYLKIKGEFGGINFGASENNKEVRYFREAEKKRSRAKDAAENTEVLFEEVSYTYTSKNEGKER